MCGNFFHIRHISTVVKQKVYKIKTGITINKDLLEIMDEYLERINNKNRSKYIEKLIFEDLKNKGRHINQKF